jgi:hypothetical protein
MRRRIGLLVGAVAALTLGLAGGSAYAYFASSGSGSGVANTGTAQSVTVVAASGSVTNKLYPGASGDLLVRITNPNSYPVTIVSLAPGSGSTTADAGHSGCTTTGVSAATMSGLNIPVASGTNVQVTIPNGATMDATSQPACQGATFSVPITITVHKG